MTLSHWLLLICGGLSLVAADLWRSLIGCWWFVAVTHWLLLICGDLALVTSKLWCVLLGWCWFVTLSHWLLLICGGLSLVAAYLCRFLSLVAADLWQSTVAFVDVVLRSFPVSCCFNLWYSLTCPPAISHWWYRLCYTISHWTAFYECCRWVFRKEKRRKNAE